MFFNLKKNNKNNKYIDEILKKFNSNIRMEILIYKIIDKLIIKKSLST